MLVRRSNFLHLLIFQQVDTIDVVWYKIRRKAWKIGDAFFILTYLVWGDVVSHAQEVLLVYPIVVLGVLPFVRGHHQVGCVCVAGALLENQLIRLDTSLADASWVHEVHRRQTELQRINKLMQFAEMQLLKSAW